MCKKCDYHFDKMLRMDDRDIPLNEPCPNCNETNCVVRDYSNQHYELTDSWRLGRLKTPKPWREFLNKIAAKNPGSSVNSD